MALQFDMDLQLPPMEDLFVVHDDGPHLGEIIVWSRDLKLRELVDVIYKNRIIDTDTLKRLARTARSEIDFNFLVCLLPVKDVIRVLGDRKTKDIQRYYGIPKWPYRQLSKVRAARRMGHLDRSMVKQAVEEIVFGWKKSACHEKIDELAQKAYRVSSI